MNKPRKSDRNAVIIALAQLAATMLQILSQHWPS